MKLFLFHSNREMYRMLEHRSKRMIYLVYNYTNRFSTQIEYHFDIQNQLFKQLQTPNSNTNVQDNPVSTNLSEGKEVENLEEEEEEKKDVQQVDEEIEEGEVSTL